MSEGQPSPENQPLINTSKFPFFKQRNKDFDQSVGRVGLHEAAVESLTKSRIKVNTSYESPETLDVLKEKPTLIVATHNFLTSETLPIISSLPPRDDIYIVGNHSFLDNGKSFKDFVLPLYISNKSAHGLAAKFLTITEFESGSPNPIKNYRKNESGIKDIIKKIDDGHQVIVYPTGNRVHQKPRKGIWHNGLGHIIRNLQKSSETYIVMVHAGQQLPIPTITDGKLYLSEINLRYSPPIKVSDLLNQFGPKNLNSQAITRVLERKYYGF